MKLRLTPVRQPSLFAAMTEVSTIAVVRGLWQALSGRDWDAVKTFPEDECVYVDMPVPALSARGPEDTLKRLKMGLEPLANKMTVP